MKIKNWTGLRLKKKDKLAIDPKISQGWLIGFQGWAYLVIAALIYMKAMPLTEKLGYGIWVGFFISQCLNKFVQMHKLLK